MVFNYKWSDSKQGNYAIRRKDTKDRPAGKEIEPKHRQTSDTHFFIWVDKNDVESMYSLYKINPILKTITYDYISRGTDKKSLTRYLTKNDIDKVLEKIINNTGDYKNIQIETSFSKEVQRVKNKLERELLKKNKPLLQESFGVLTYEKMLNLLKKSIIKEQELTKKKREAETKIKGLKKEIKKIHTDILESEKTTNAEKEKLEKMVFTIFQGRNKHLQYTGGEGVNNFQNILEVFYGLAKTDKKREAGNLIKKRSIDKKNAGKEKRKVGRPKKSE